MEESNDDAQLEVLKNSGMLVEFVRNTGGSWNQADLESLLIRIREQNITVNPDKIGALLEAERVAHCQNVVEKVTEGEVTVNFDKLGLRKKREFLGIELKKRIR